MWCPLQIPTTLVIVTHCHPYLPVSDKKNKMQTVGTFQHISPVFLLHTRILEKLEILFIKNFEI